MSNLLGSEYLGLRRQRRTRTTGRRWRSRSLKRMYKPYIASLRQIVESFQADGSNLVERMQMPWPKETMVDLMKSSGMAGRTVMTTKDKRRYLHSCSRARTEAALLTC